LIAINVDPVAFKIGVPLYWSGIIVTLAGAALLLWMIWHRKQIPGLSLNRLLNVALVALVSAVVLGRLFYVLENRDFYIENPGRILGVSGLRMWGALLGLALSVAIYSKLKNIPVLPVLDLLVPGLLLFQIIYRFNCTIYGCCYGIPTSLPWGVIYTRPESPAYLASLDLPLGMGLHPVVVYEIVFCLIVLGVMFYLRKRIKPEGSLFLLFIVLYAGWRLSTDFLRAGTPLVFGLQQSQVFSILALVVAIPLLVYRITKTQRLKRSSNM
jgi:phosphatidylglycerol---prolipoprotein diacylglyceryl transferase